MLSLFLILITNSFANDVTHIDFEDVEVTGKLSGPSLEFVQVSDRPSFNSLLEDVFPGFSIDLNISEDKREELNEFLDATSEDLLVK